MTFDLAPEFRVATERSHLIRARGHFAPESLPEFALDAILAKLAELLRPGGIVTKAAVAGAVEAGAAIALHRAGVQGCADCGHAWADHPSLRGCWECGCTARRPHATECFPSMHPGGAV